MNICSQDSTSPDDITNSENVPKFYVDFMNDERIALDLVPTITVAEVLNLIKDSHDIENQTLEFEGKHLKLHRSIAECGVHENSILRLVTRDPKMHIIVILPGGDIAVLEVESTDTIIRVKEKIHEQFRILPELQKLLTGFEVFEDTETLAHYNVQNGSTLQLILRLNNSGNCIICTIHFNTPSEKNREEFSSSAPDWRTVYRGLNFFSTCLNPDCSAYNQYICVKKGFGSFDIDEVSCQLQCPQCHKPAKNSKNCGFYKAKWDLCGMVKNEEIITTSGIANTDHYYNFNEGLDHSSLCVKLTVSELPVKEWCRLW